MPLRAVICDVYNTLFRNEPSSWIATFGEICRLQGLTVTPQKLYDVWKSHEMGFRRVRTNLERPEASPPFKSYRTAWTEAFVDAFRDLGLQGDRSRQRRCPWMGWERASRSRTRLGSWSERAGAGGSRYSRTPMTIS